MRRLTPLLLLAPALVYCRIDSISVGVDSAAAEPPKRQPASASKAAAEFVPLVAFQCGYKNRYVDKGGKWASDADRYATCLTGKLDILKYCRKVYPSLDITNIVEYSHHQTVEDWCKETEPTKCKWQFTVQPYQCIVGEFRGEALHVPDGCRFGHVDERQTCDDFAHWHNQAIDECGRRLAADSRTMRVHSFAMLEPCGLDLFSGVEFVCCPQTAAAATVGNKQPPVAKPKDYGKEKAVKGDDKKLPLPKSAAIAESDVKPEPAAATADSGPAEPDEDISWADDEDDDDYWNEGYDSDEEDDDEDESYDDDEDEMDSPTTKRPAVSAAAAGADAHPTDDPYFRLADPDNEHAMYREALDRLDQKHRERIAKIMREWAELENRYMKMKQADPKYADKFKAETRERFQKTVGALSEEIDEQRRQIKEVHQERVAATINQHKRDAIGEFRSALADAMTQPKAADVLGALERYIRAEEKDRSHTLKQYRHSVKRGDAADTVQRAEVLRRLRDIDMRINGTISMLRDFPELEKKVKPVAVGYWRDFRHANTPYTQDALATSLGGAGKDEHLLKLYEAEIDGQRTAAGGGELPADLKQSLDAFRVLEPVSTVLRAPVAKKIMDAPVPPVQFSRVDAHIAEAGSLHESEHASAAPGHGLLLYVSAAAVCAVGLLLGVALVRRRRANGRPGQGFIEVDLYTPEERQVATMQCNGYENPTYAYFERT